MKKYKRHLDVILLFIVLIEFTNCNSVSNKPKSAEELKMELKQQEQNSPSRYLTLNGVTMQHNKTRDAGLFHGAEYDGYLVQGSIKSTATVARFKDIVITVKLLSQTETVIAENDYVIYQFYEPNSISNFSIKVNPPSACEKFNASVKTATSVLN